MTDKRRAVLGALCDTAVPRLEREDDPDGFWARSGSDVGAPEALAQAIEQMPPQQRDDFARLLDGLAQTGFLPASRRSREQLLSNLAALGPQAAAGGQALVELALFFAYGAPDPHTGQNPFWQTFGYPGPTGAPEQRPRAIAPLVPEGHETAHGELHDVPRVWIGDASAFPTPSGTNPMITIMALGRRTGEAILAASPAATAAVP